jgi:hypothetical protein
MRGIPIARSVLALVAVLPMLMPSGMCLCQWSSAGPTATPTGGVSPAAKPPGPVCGCHHCHKHDGEAADDGDDTRVGTQRPGRVPDPGPCPRDHRPDCPVVTGLSIRVAVLADATAGYVCRPASAAEWACPPTAAVTSRGPPGPAAVPSSPLFISHCALLI